MMTTNDEKLIYKPQHDDDAFNGCLGWYVEERDRDRERERDKKDRKMWNRTKNGVQHSVTEIGRKYTHTRYENIAYQRLVNNTYFHSISRLYFPFPLNRLWSYQYLL